MDPKLEYPDIDEASHAQPTANNNNGAGGGAGGGRVEMEQAEIDAIIRNKRKARDPKACYACHRRKVKVSLYPCLCLCLPGQPQ
jgi:hypothetical protein